MIGFVKDFSDLIKQKNKKNLKHTNTQIHKHTNTQVRKYKYTNEGGDEAGMRTKIKTPTLGLVDEVYEVALGDRYRKFYQTLNNAKKTFNSIFLRIIHPKKIFI